MPIFVDEFDIEGQYQNLRKLVNFLEKDIYKFISPTKNKQASVRARKTLREIRALTISMRKNISKQRHHNDSEYE